MFRRVFRQVKGRSQAAQDRRGIICQTCRRDSGATMVSPNEASRNSSAKHIDDLSGPLHPTSALWERSYFTGHYDNSSLSVPPSLFAEIFARISTDSPAFPALVLHDINLKRNETRRIEGTNEFSKPNFILNS